MGVIGKLLRDHDLRVTQVRRRILELLQECDSAMAQPDLEVLLSEFDRVTIYRTLSVFEEKGLVHRVINEHGVGNYALCAEGCAPHEHHDHHPHLECDQCGRIYCLDQVVIPPVNIPKEYAPHGLKITVQGVCDHCRNDSEMQPYSKWM